MPEIKLCQYPLGEGGKLMENPENKVWELTGLVLFVSIFTNNSVLNLHINY